MREDDFDPYDLKPSPTQGVSPSGAFSHGVRMVDTGGMEAIPTPEGPPQEGWAQGTGSLGERDVRNIESWQTELESRANVDSLDRLQHERRLLKQRLVKLEYLFGSGGDREQAKRRRHRDGIQRLLMSELNPIPTEKKLEALANSDRRHVAFCEHLEQQFDVWYRLRNELDDLTERIESRLEELRCYRKEAGLQ